MTLGERGPSRPDTVFKRLVLDIMSGRYAAGQSLPSERALSDQLSVSRSVLREALKRLTQLGLVATQHGGSSRTTDYRRTAGLDLLGVLAGDSISDERSPSWWLPLLEMRAAIGADVARLCALRAAPEVRAELVALAERMTKTAEPAAIFELEVQFWTRMLDGADNLAYRLAFNTMMRALHGSGESAHQVSFLEVQRSGFRVPLANAIALGDADRAEHEARGSLRRSAELFARFLDHNGAAKKAPTRPLAADAPVPDRSA